MRLLRACDVGTIPESQEFFYSRTRAVLLMLSLLAASVAFFILGLTQSSPLGYYLGGLALLSLLFARGYVAPRFRSTNWLVRRTSTGLLIKFRSYLNYRLPDTDLTVVSIEYSEIRSARMVRESISVPDSEGGTSTETRRWIELELAGISQELIRALAADQARPAPGEKRWYGSSSTLYRHYPVGVTTPGFLRVEWNVTPSGDVFLDALRSFTTVLPEVAIADDFANLQDLTRMQQEERLRELDARGKTVTAVYAARRLYGYNLAEATLFIEDLRTGVSAR